MFQKLLDMYVGSRINEVYLAKAVKLGWITEEEMQEIIGFKALLPQM
ncbi:XkdX family protein [Clostridium celatum]|uniref:XkdX family protein n=1 Tax=Clostridium celatum DSM 1785 TaxID=545697 RepID=L1QFS4_9CLOT|nr:XkdX family protein [Clostridium celatum]EKY26545.1 hypothetical protein HMPREF0216_01730 [Clostridium celatum DSM 1785]